MGSPAQVASLRAATEPLLLGHPRAAEVSVLAADSALGLFLLTHGTLVFRLDAADSLSPMPLSLRVDQTFVSMSAPPLATPGELRRMLESALPEDYALLSHLTQTCLVATVIRTFELRPVSVACTSRDARQRVVRSQADRFVIRGTARGNGALDLKVNEQHLRLVPCPGDAPLMTALRLRELLSPSFAVLLAVPSDPAGDVCVTVLPH